MSDELVRLALVMYCGEPCVECGHVYTSVDDLIARQVVFAGYHGAGRVCCGVCWPAHTAKPCEVCEEMKRAQK